MSQRREDFSLITTGKLFDEDSIVSDNLQSDVSQKNSYFSVILKVPILFYQEFISSQMKPRCYFYPSCSQFSLEAIQLYGFTGVFLGIDRIMRCNVFSEEKYPLYDNTTSLYDPISHYRLNNKNDKQPGHFYKINSISPSD
jgi:putative membrane protein insertion efficiency factor